MNIWEFLSTTLTSPWGCVSLLLILAIIVSVAVILVKKGIIKYKGHGLDIGNIRDNERSLLRNQMQYCKSVCDTWIFGQSDLPSNIDIYKARYINELIYDELVATISFNHITDKRAYIKAKQSCIWSVIVSNTETTYFHSEDLKKRVDAKVEEIILTLLEMRSESEKIN